MRKIQKTSNPRVGSRKGKKEKEIEKEPGTELTPSQASLIRSYKDIFLLMEESFPNWDLRSFSEQELIIVAKELMRFVATRINTKGEVSYVAKKTALFLAEMLLGALRRGVPMREVPEVHTVILEELYTFIDSAKTGLYGEPDVMALSEEAERHEQILLRKIQLKAGKVPQKLIVP